MDLDQWMLVQLRVELGLEVGLIEHVCGRPPGTAHAGGPQAKQRNAFPISPLVGVSLLREHWENWADSARLKDAGRLVVEVDGPWKRIGRCPPFDHDHLSPAVGEEQREHSADGSAADHGDIDRPGTVGPGRVGHGHLGRAVAVWT